MPSRSPRNSAKKRKKGYMGRGGDDTTVAGAADNAGAAAALSAAAANANAEAVKGRFARHGIRADEKSTEIKKSIDKHITRNTWRSSVIILIGVACNAIYMFTQGAMEPPKDDASDADKLAHNQVVSFLNVSTIILTVFFIYRTYRTMLHSATEIKRIGILDYATMGALFANNLLVIYSNLRNEETGSRTFILIIVLLCIMLLLMGLNVYDTYSQKDVTPA